MRLLLVPHALTDWNAQGRYQGQTDTALSDIGKRHAALLARRLFIERIDEVYASDLRRAQETVTAICELRKLSCHSDSRLRELRFGAWEGLTYSEVQQGYAKELANWEADPLRTAPPGGETVTQLADRIGAFLADLNGTPGQDRSVLLVAHRGSLRALICVALAISPAARWQFHLEPASLSAVDLHPEGAVLRFLNDTHHLRELAHAY